MSTAERFEDLRIWQAARTLVNTVYELTETLRDFEFKGQIRSAAISAMNNIAEGFERRTDSDFAHFLDIAKGSAGEVRSMLYLGEDRRYFTCEEANRVRDEATSLAKGIAQLAKHLRSGSS